jgi:hypothetical protein
LRYSSRPLSYTTPSNFKEIFDSVLKPKLDPSANPIKTKDSSLKLTFEHLSKICLTHSAAPSPVFKDGGEKARLRVNPEPLGCTRGLELVERQALAFRPGSRRVDFN